MIAPGEFLKSHNIYLSNDTTISNSPSYPSSTSSDVYLRPGQGKKRGACSR